MPKAYISAVWRRGRVSLVLSCQCIHLTYSSLQFKLLTSTDEYFNTGRISCSSCDTAHNAPRQKFLRNSHFNPRNLSGFTPVAARKAWVRGLSPHRETYWSRIRRWIVWNLQILIVSAVKICKRCLQTASASGGLPPHTPYWTPLGNSVHGTPGI